ncbi:MAG: hypothetical protein QOE51_4638, partial [Actinoplanes sp.]|nr:hypothetical protein [Actinoplanes sp.]
MKVPSRVLWATSRPSTVARQLIVPVSVAARM